MTDSTPIDIKDLFAQGALEKPVSIYGQPEKEKLAEEGTPFVVTDIKMGDDEQYGGYWEVSAKLNGEPIQFRLSQHDRRDAFMSGIASVVVTQPISGLRLRAYKGQAGNAFIAMEPAS